MIVCQFDTFGASFQYCEIIYMYMYVYIHLQSAHF